MPDAFDFTASTLRIGDGPEMPVLNCEITWNHGGDLRTTYTLGEGGLAGAGTIHWDAGPDVIALFDVLTQRAEDEARYRARLGQQMEAVSEWVNSLLPPEVAAAGLHWEWSATDGPDETLDAANRHADERIAEWRYRMAQVPPGYDGVIGSLEGVYDANTQIITDDGPLLYWGEALTPADSNTPLAGSMTCAHICGPDPDHVCDARAVTFLEHKNLAGGTTRTPMCGPCHRAETAAMEATDA